MKAAISGSSGFQGKALLAMLYKLGYEVVPLSRKDLYGSPEGLSKKIRGAGVIIHLAGAPIIGRWTPKYRKEIYDSRILTTRTLTLAMGMLDQKPHTFICASAVGIYPNKGSFTEDNTAIAGNFLGKVCQDWETEASKAPAEVRVLNFRFGIVLGKNGGALPKMALPFRLFIGGKIASGNQMVSWVHLQDVLRIFRFALENKDLAGAVNICAPQPVTNKQLSQTIARVLGRPAFFPVPAFALSLVFGKGAMILTQGQHALPKKLQDAGFQFQFPELTDALKDLLK
ncbi:MAG: TIGR01777 family oxidoreductase [Bacteroidales bacterium]|jgi:uncharacterized protein (TIGR01777 family)|nr:TIGR01777 family oxidoreductase [Bacteroidales bacterium]